MTVFVIFANIVFGTFTTSGRIAQEFSGLTSEQVANLPGAVLKQVPQGAAGTASKIFSGSYLEPRNQDSVAQGQQIVTALITLVTAISAFYFGSSSLSSASRAIEGPESAHDSSSRYPCGTQTQDGGGFDAITIELNKDGLGGGSAKASIRGDDHNGGVTSVHNDMTPPAV